MAGNCSEVQPYLSIYPLAAILLTKEREKRLVFFSISCNLFDFKDNRIKVELPSAAALILTVYGLQPIPKNAWIYQLWSAKRQQCHGESSSHGAIIDAVKD